MSSKTRLCIATGIFAPESGGPAKFAESYAFWARENNRNLSFVSLTDGPDSQSPFFGFSATLVSRKRTFLLRFFKTVLSLIKASKHGSVILANGLFLEMLAFSLLTPKRHYFTKIPGDIVWERARNVGYTKLTIDQFQKAKLSFKWRIFRYLFTKSLQRSRAVIVPSRHLFNLCLGWGIEENKLQLIYNSVDNRRFTPMQIDKTWDVITVCRLVPWKGVDEVIETCARLNLSLCIIGDGPERLSLENLVATLGSKAQFLGNQSQIGVLSALRRSKCFVLNSNFEATAYALNEARAVGLPCIARRSTGSEEVITHEYDGLLCGENSTLEEALRMLMDNYGLYKKMSERAVADVESRFSTNTNFQRIYELVMR